MTPLQFRNLRIRMHLTQAELAQQLGSSAKPDNAQGIIARYENGSRPIPSTVQASMEMLAQIKGIK